MAFLDEAAYLEDVQHSSMGLPQELMESLGADVTAAPAAGTVPEGWVSLPGGIIIRKSTAILLGVALIVLVAWWYSNRKKRRK